MIPHLTVERSIPAPGTHLCGIAWDGKHLWHSNASSNRLYRLDPQTGKVFSEIPCPEVRTDLISDGKILWQIAGHPKKILVIDPEHGQVLLEMPLGPDGEHACGLTVAQDKYWVPFEHLALITEYSQKNYNLLLDYKVLPRVAGLERVDNTLWYTEYEKSLLMGLDMATGEELPLQFAGQPYRPMLGWLPLLVQRFPQSDDFCCPSTIGENNGPLSGEGPTPVAQTLRAPLTAT